jgi:hypothetical protein
MKNFPEITGICTTALDLHRRGLRLVPLIGKQAFLKSWQTLHLGESGIREWASHGVNFGIITGDPLVVLDTDSEAAESWVKEKGIGSPVIVRSGGGGLHRYFRCPEDIELHSRIGLHKIRGLDVKAWNSYIVAAGSIHPETNQRYEYLPGREMMDVHQLPVFDAEWMREIYPERVLTMGSTGAERKASGPIRNVHAYIRHIPSIQGRNGSNAAYRVAALLYEAGLTFDEILAELEAWNKVCAVPPWIRKELIHKVESVFQRKHAANFAGDGR